MLAKMLQILTIILGWGMTLEENTLLSVLVRWTNAVHNTVLNPLRVYEHKKKTHKKTKTSISYCFHIVCVYLVISPTSLTQPHQTTSTPLVVLDFPMVAFDPFCVGVQHGEIDGCSERFGGREAGPSPIAESNTLWTARQGHVLGKKGLVQEVIVSCEEVTDGHRQVIGTALLLHLL